MCANILCANLCVHINLIISYHILSIYLSIYLYIYISVCVRVQCTVRFCHFNSHSFLDLVLWTGQNAPASCICCICCSCCSCCCCCCCCCICSCSSCCCICCCGCICFCCCIRKFCSSAISKSEAADGLGCSGSCPTWESQVDLWWSQTTRWMSTGMIIPRERKRS